MEIKSRFTGKVIFSDSSENIKETVQNAVKAKVSLVEADLVGAKLGGANLVGADLRGADLYEADLRGANLYGADLGGADLTRADLGEADLAGADLAGADLTRADLAGADLGGADLVGAKGLGQFIRCPAGEVIVYKKLDGDKIASLRVPADAQRVNSIGSNKCRCDKAFVISITDRAGNPVQTGCSRRDLAFIYTVGEMVFPSSYDPSDRIECSAGIHFFLTESEAKEY